MAFWDRLEERIAALPGVRSVGLVNCPPFGCHWGSFYLPEGAAPVSFKDSNPVVVNRVATPTYFRTMGIRLKAGRFFEPTDGRDPKAERIVIVNETFAKTFFPGVENPVGRRIRSTGDEKPWKLIVGYVEDVKHYGLERPMRPGVYWPHRQQTMVWNMAVAMKTDGGPEALLSAARGAVRELDPELPLFNIRTMETALARTLAARTTYSWMLAVFALTALVLALGGTYGVSSYLVTQRTREIGIRVALGAARTDIVRSVLRGSLAVVAAGIAAGVIASIGVGRLLEALLFGVAPNDLVIMSSATAILLAAAVVANLLPARRAARVDPMISLRTE